MTDGPQEDTLVCPVCRAAQAWCETCRRCRCDLGLLYRAEQARRSALQAALRNLRDGRWAEALGCAQASHALRPTADSRRLLAVCCLLGGDFQHAVNWAKSALVLPA
jgi:hypothetical protein